VESIACEVSRSTMLPRRPGGEPDFQPDFQTNLPGGASSFG
jgi:hypothetical protein